VLTEPAIKGNANRKFPRRTWFFHFIVSLIAFGGRSVEFCRCKSWWESASSVAVEVGEGQESSFSGRHSGKTLRW
jgi:hypothetical protein